MKQYRIYERQTLDYIDGGVVRDYNIDMDYIANNSSSISITQESSGDQGDIVAIMEKMKLIELGVIESIDNTEKKIKFKHMKELFNDTIINVFKYTSLLSKKYEAIQGLKTILESTFINCDDEKKKLPIEFETHGKEESAIYTDDNETINLSDYISSLFDTYNIYLDFFINFKINKIVCTITKNTTEGYYIKDNIKLSKATFDNNDMPTYNTAKFYDETTGEIKGEYYLLLNNKISLQQNATNRILPVKTKYIKWDEADAIKNGYTMQEQAESELMGNIYNHCIEYKLSKEQNMVNAKSFKYGDQVTIIYKDREYNTIFTGLKYNMTDPYYTCIFGKARIDFTDRLKLYNDKRYKKV